MSRESILILIGVLIMLAPFVGLPYFWLMFVLPVLGVIVIGLAVALRARSRAAESTAPSFNETSSST